MTELQISPFNDVLSAFSRGEMVIMVDDRNRENEGDLVIATERVTTEALSFMMREARGLICVSLSRERLEALELPLQVLNNNSPFNTQFTVSVDSREVAAAGVTAAARAQTLKRLVDPLSVASDFVIPGHVFPLVANGAGVIGRQGQTEGSFDLARIAGFQPSGVICEILNDDGTMARAEELMAFAKRHKLLLTSVAEVAKYRINQEVLLRETACSSLNTDFGIFETSVFQDDVDGKEHLVLKYGDFAHADTAPLVRIHSECLTGDVFASRRCDCGRQLNLALEAIVAEGAGVVLYLRQEGRGIGLMNKLRAYALQDQGSDTVEANLKLGFEADQRDFVVAAKILGVLGLNRVRLLTNNPKKQDALARYGVGVVETVPLRAEVDEFNRAYLDTKRDKLGHAI